MELKDFDRIFQKMLITVKLGYNEHGYIKFVTITYNILDLSGPIRPLYSIKSSRLWWRHGYNEQRARTNTDGPVEFVITKFISFNDFCDVLKLHLTKTFS